MNNFDICQRIHDNMTEPEERKEKVKDNDRPDDSLTNIGITKKVRGWKLYL